MRFVEGNFEVSGSKEALEDPKAVLFCDISSRKAMLLSREQSERYIRDHGADSLIPSLDTVARPVVAILGDGTCCLGEAIRIPLPPASAGDALPIMTKGGDC